MFAVHARVPPSVRETTIERGFFHQEIVRLVHGYATIGIHMGSLC